MEKTLKEIDLELESLHEIRETIDKKIALLSRQREELSARTKKEYIQTAEDRIRDFAKCADEQIGGFTMTAIHKELETIFDVGCSRQ